MRAIACLLCVLLAPVLAALGALAAPLTHVKIEVDRERKDETDGERSS